MLSLAVLLPASRSLHWTAEPPLLWIVSIVMGACTTYIHSLRVSYAATALLVSFATLAFASSLLMFVGSLPLVHPI